MAWLGLARLLLIGLVLAWALVVLVTAWRLSRPRRRGYASRVARGLPADASDLSPEPGLETWTTSGGGCPVWELRGDQPQGPVMIFAHGWGRSRHDVLDRFTHLRGEISAMIACDLPGHGESGAEWCGLGANEHAVLNELIESVATDTPVVLWGWSMGAGIALRAAIDGDGPSRIAGVVFESGYARAVTPARAVLRAAGLPHRFTLRPALWIVGLIRGDRWRGFDRRELARRSTCPVLVLHGDRDEVCPIEDAEQVAAACPEGALRVLAGARHRDGWTDQFAKEATQAVTAFLREIEAQ